VTYGHGRGSARKHRQSSANLCMTAVCLFEIQTDHSCASAIGLAKFLWWDMFIRTRQRRYGPDHPDLVGNRHRVMPASNIQFFLSGMGTRSSSSLERNSFRIGEAFALL
jgi:hypothetical protein